MVDMKIIEHLKDRFSYWMEIRSYGKQKRKEPLWVAEPEVVLSDKLLKSLEEYEN
tara:strand:+ start:19868 stop:20032 length:165 start_codon:yes stop_codon:yes gene_type:complete